jgi:hypothetical protein
MKAHTFSSPADGVSAAWIDEHWFQRALEIFPGLVTWITLLSPIFMSIFQPEWVAYFIIAFDLYWMTKSFRLSTYLIRAYRRLHWASHVNWSARLQELTNLDQALLAAQDLAATARGRDARRRARVELARLQTLAARRQDIIDPSTIYHAVIMATYNESIDILEPSVKALTEVQYPLERILFVLAYEERGGPRTEENARALVEKHGQKFGLAMAVRHPAGVAGEIIGKGANITWAGRALTESVHNLGIDPKQVVVTTFDSDHRASTQYFNYLTYEYAIDPARKYKSYQPIPMFYNNIWDVPAPMRVIATGNSFWILMEMMRPHRLRNFAAHAQPLEALIDTDYWSVTTIVEDGHQYWRTYFRYNGRHDVVPLFTPVYQDAVLAETYWKTFLVQFLQLRRWAWGVSDFAFAVRHSLKNPRIAWSNKLAQLGRLFEGHFSWATAPLILMFVAWLPLLLNRQFSVKALAHNLPIITSDILMISTVAIVITIFLSLILLPPKPTRYRKTRFVIMLAQWILLPATGIGFGAFAAINAQTRLMFGRYLEFYVTEKATKK